MSQNICLLGATDKDGFFFKNSQILKDNGYIITLIVSNHTFDSDDDCPVISFDKIDVNKIISNNDIIIICKSPQCTDAFIFSLLKNLLLYKKKIYNYHVLDFNYELELSKLASEQKGDYHYFGNREMALKNMSIPIPVIYIMSLFEDMEKMNLELALNSILNRRGYKSGLISSNAQGEFFGVPSFPFDIFDQTHNINVMSNNLFRYIDNYIKNNELNILIIGIPSALFLPYDDFNISFSLYLLKKICPPDYIILNILNNTLNNNSIEDIDSLVFEEINKSIDTLFITSTIDDVVTYENTKPNRSFSITYNSNICVPNSNKLIVSEINENKYELIADDIESKLS